MIEKKDFLNDLRQRAERQLANLSPRLNYKQKARILNGYMRNLKEELIAAIKTSHGTKQEILEHILLIDYCTNIVMLESRNKVWPYEYMDFSRRIGELWEPFCKLPFEHPVRPITLYDPPEFDDVKTMLKREITGFIQKLSITPENRSRLTEYFDSVWQLVESGGVKLSLDLHFSMNEQFYNVDFKSGFSSNEKGNTNRLLLVASIYKSLPEKHNMLMFVRQTEEENNHYLQTLKNSPHWNVFCSEEAYEKITEFSGFPLRTWMEANMEWERDITDEFYDYLKENDLLSYLRW